MDYKKIIDMISNNINIGNEFDNEACQTILSQIHTTIFGARELLYAFIVLKENKYQIDRHRIQAFCLEKISSFARLMQNKNIAPNIIDNAKYMICSMLDEGIVTSYFQNEGDIGVYKSLVSQHYNDELGGEKFFAILEKLNPNNNEHLPLLLLGNYILSLGFQGKYLLLDNSQKEITAIRNKIFFSTNKILKQLIHNYNNPRIQIEPKSNLKFVKNYLYSGLFIASTILIGSLYYLLSSKNCFDQILF